MLTPKQKQKASAEWMKLQKIRLQELQQAGSTGRRSGGGAQSQADARQRAAFAKSPRGVYLKSQGGNAFEIGFRNKFHGGYRPPSGANLNATGKNSELAIYLEMTGQQNPYSSRGPGGSSTVVSGQGGVRTVQNPDGSTTTTYGQGQGGGDPLSDFLGEWQNQNDAANQANDDRYIDIKNQYQERYDRGQEMLNNFGASKHADALEAAKQTAGAQVAALSGRGLGDRAIGYQNKVASDLGRQQLAIDDSVTKLKMQSDAQLSDDKLRFMERRTDQAPDYSSMLGMAEKYGLGNGGAGFGYASPQGQQQMNQGSGGNLQALQNLMGTPQFGSSVVGGPQVGPVGGNAYQPRQRPVQGLRGPSRQDNINAGRKASQARKLARIAGRLAKTKKGTPINNIGRPGYPGFDPYLSPFSTEEYA